MKTISVIGRPQEPVISITGSDARNTGKDFVVSSTYDNNNERSVQRDGDV
jgi:hypothetical protein